eukprot:gene14872-17587_t
MTTLEFVIPIHYEDVGHHSKSKFTRLNDINVKQFDDKAQLSMLATQSDKIKKDPLAILHQNTFDVLYAFVAAMRRGLSPEVRNSLLRVLQSGPDLLQKIIEKLLDKTKQIEDADEYGQRLAMARNAAKIYVFLVHSFIQHHREIENAAQSAPTSTQPTPKGAKKGRKVPRPDTDDNWMLDNEKDRMLAILYNLLDHNLAHLWRLDFPEEEFVNLFVKIVLSILEKPADAKSQNIRRSSFSIIGVLVYRYNFVANFISTVVHHISSHEHLAQHMAELFEQITKAYPSHIYLIGEIIRDVGRAVSNDSPDSTSSKNLSKFIVSLSATVPKFVLPQFPLLEALLANNNYQVRNAVVESLGSLIRFGFETDEKEKDKERDASRDAHRDMLLEMLLSRHRDSNSFTRNTVLSTWSDLVGSGCVPNHIFPDVTVMAIGRLVDKTVYARKYALQLLTKCIMNNPYTSTNLRSAWFISKLEVFAAIIKDLHEQDEAIRASQEIPDDEEEQREEEAGDPETDPDFKFLSTKLAINKDKLVDLLKGTTFEKNKGLLSYPFTKLLKLLKNMKKYLEESVRFVQIVNGSLDKVSQLLHSTSTTDVQESVKFFVEAHRLNLDGHKEGVTKMLLLVWHKDKAVQDTIRESFKEILLTTTSAQSKAHYFIAKNLIE